MERQYADTVLSALETIRELMQAADDRGDARAARTYFGAISQAVLDLLMRVDVPVATRRIVAVRLRRLICALPETHGLGSIRVKFDYAVSHIVTSVRTGRIDQRVILPLESAATS